MIELEEFLHFIALDKGTNYRDPEIEAIFNSKEIFPSQHCVVATRRAGSISVFKTTFGGKFQSATSAKASHVVINARVETVMSKPMFKQAFQDARCIVPVSGYYEWKKSETGKKLPYLIQVKNSHIGLLAGLLITSTTSTTPFLVIITQEASTLVQDIHPRQPLHLSPSHLDMWLGTSPISKCDLERIKNVNDIALEANPVTKESLTDTTVAISTPSKIATENERDRQLRLF